jgi:hypothetical protein
MLQSLVIRAPSSMHMHIHTHLYEDFFTCLDYVGLAFLTDNDRIVIKVLHFTSKPNKNMKTPLFYE